MATKKPAAKKAAPDQRSRPKVHRGANTATRSEAPSKPDPKLGKAVSPRQGVPVESLRDQIGETPVWYEMRVAKVQIAPKDKQIVEVNGKYDYLPIPGFKLEAIGPKNSGGMSRNYYPQTREVDAKFVAAVDQWVREWPDQAAEAGIRKHSGVKVPAPIPTWNELKAEACANIIRDGNLDLKQAMQYEVENRNRDDVIAALEQVHVERVEAEARKAEDEAETQLGDSVDAVAI